MILRQAFIFVSEWLESVGLSTAPDKGEAMHHSWRRDRGYSPPIKLPMPDGTEATIVAGETIRILGLHIDRKLTFNRHTKIVADKAMKAVNCTLMLANTIRGLSQSHLRTLYRACVIPIMTYASPAWWTGKKTHLNTLNKVQNTALRHMAGAFRTTPIKALEVDMSIPPLSISLELAVESYANRLHRLPRSHPIISRLTEEWRDNQPPTSPPPLPSQKPRTRARQPNRPRNKGRTQRTRLEQIARATYDPRQGEKVVPMSHPPWDDRLERYRGKITTTGTIKGITKEEAAKTHVERANRLMRNDTNLLVYSDGSMLENGRDRRNIGWGVVGFHGNREVFARRGSLGHAAEVYDAEMHGLTAAARLAVGYQAIHPVIKNIYIFADNSAAIGNIYGVKDSPGQSLMDLFTQTAEAFVDKANDYRINIEWCPGHSDILGNERADREAKKGAEMWHPGHITLTHAKRMARERALAKWTAEWKRTPPYGGFAHANKLPPTWKPRQHVVETSREVFARLTQCRTRHAFVGEYYAKFVPTESVACPCGHRYQTREHILKECPTYDEHRECLREFDHEIDMGKLLGTKEGIKALSKFLKQSGAFTKTGHPREELKKPEENDDEEAETEDEEEWWRRREEWAEEEEWFGRVEEDDPDMAPEEEEEEDDGWWD